MAFLKTNILTTREPVFGSRRLGQIVVVPSGRLDKVSVYLEPTISDTAIASAANVIVEVYDLDGFGLPTGSPLASDSKMLSEFTVPGFFNFSLLTFCPTIVSVVVRMTGGDQNNFVAWRYVSSSAGSEELLISTDDGATWTADPTRKFAYKTFSLIPNAVDPDAQTALIAPGRLQLINDNTGAEFSLGTLERTAITGDTVAINFGDFVVTLVVDQSGSMTWNDHNNVRYQFLKDFIADLDASLPSTSTATYSLVKFKGRKIGNLSIGISGSNQFGLHFDGVRIVRKVGVPPLSIPANINDGLIVFEGLADRFEDQTAVSGTPYCYSIFSFADFNGSPLFSTAKSDFVLTTTPVNTPVGVAAFRAAIVPTDSVGTTLPTGATQLGFNRVDLSWQNPTNYDYVSLTLVRRDDRIPESPVDGTILLNGVFASSTTSFTDTFGGNYEPVNGLTYFYRIFTTNTAGIKSIPDNSSNVSAAIPLTPRPWELVAGGTPPFGFPTTPPGPPVVSIIQSNGEMNLSWVPADLISVRYQLYYDPSAFPQVLNDKGTLFSGTLLFDGSATSFNHRFLLNGQPHFYVLLAYDYVGNVSTPVKPLIGLVPPKPSATALQFLPPDPVAGFEVEVTNSTTNTMTWKNPQAPAQSDFTFFFGDSVKITSTVDFVDSGNSQLFLTYEFNEVSRNVTLIDPANVVDPKIAMQFAHVASLTPDAITGIVSVTPLLSIQNKLETAMITFEAVISVKNRNTNAVLAQVKSSQVTVTFNNPFILAIKNDPPQSVSIRTFEFDPNNQDGDPCHNKIYKVDSVPGVYVFSGDPFFALIEASFRDLALGAPLDVTVSLIDPVTGLATTLVPLPQANGAGTVVLTTTDIQDESLDRSGQPSGDSITRSLIPLILPPSNIPGIVTIQATGTFNGYTRSVTLDVRYQSVLNIDLNLAAFQTDNVDIAEQSAFVYLAPFDADASKKIPVDDFTITTWDITPLCDPPVIRPLTSQDNVPGLGIKSFTRGGLAQKIFWGPGDGIKNEELYQIHVIATAKGMSGEGFGVVALEPPSINTFNKIFLRKVGGFSDDQIVADGIASSSWEVVAKPEDDAGSGPTDISSGQFFRNAVLTAGGRVPSLDDDRIVTLSMKANDNTAANDPNHLSVGGLNTVTNNIRIFSNMTGPNGKAMTAKARIVNGKANFLITANAKVPILDEGEGGLDEKSLQPNLIYGVPFDTPKTGLYLTLTATTIVEVNGLPVTFVGGGGDLFVSAPPTFIALTEPLQITTS